MVIAAVVVGWIGCSVLAYGLLHYDAHHSGVTAASGAACFIALFGPFALFSWLAAAQHRGFMWRVPSAERTAPHGLTEEERDLLHSANYCIDHLVQRENGVCRLCVEERRASTAARYEEQVRRTNKLLDRLGVKR
jgi:hypothetical protein